MLGCGCLDTLGFVGTVRIAIIVLVLFFKGIGAIGRSRRGKVRMVEGLLSAERANDVTLTNGRVISGVQFVGVSDASGMKGGMPYQLSQLMVFQRPDGGKVYVRPDSIRLIEEQSAALRT